MTEHARRAAGRDPRWGATGQVNPGADWKPLAEEIARYDAILVGACGEPYRRDLQTLARVFDIDPGGLSPGRLWTLLRPKVTDP